MCHTTLWAGGQGALTASDEGEWFPEVESGQKHWQYSLLPLSLSLFIC